jgi:hypothetical protein
MPRGDRTGPMGLGPRTGRSAGYCAGYPVPGYMNPAGGRLGMGFAWGRGRGHAWRRPFVPYGMMPYSSGPYGDWSYSERMSREEEREMLQNQAKAVQEQLKTINKRIGDLEKEKEE